MKRILFFALLLCCSFWVFAQEEKPVYNGTGAEIYFTKTSINLGTLNLGDVKETYFVFQNIGKKPLILDDVIISCDCTEIDWPKAPVMPGQSAKIKVTYTAKHSGSINKWATVLSNAESDRVILRIKGEVN